MGILPVRIAEKTSGQLCSSFFIKGPRSTPVKTAKTTQPADHRSEGKEYPSGLCCHAGAGGKSRETEGTRCGAGGKGLGETETSAEHTCGGHRGKARTCAHRTISGDINSGVPTIVVRDSNFRSVCCRERSSLRSAAVAVNARGRAPAAAGSSVAPPVASVATAAGRLSTAHSPKSEMRTEALSAWVVMSRLAGLMSRCNTP
eukprot:scaffold7723_cov100-Isochrysis_galbana.AAC.1